MTTTDRADRLSAIREQTARWGGTNTLIEKTDLGWLLSEVERQDTYIAALREMVQQMAASAGAQIMWAADGTAHVAWPGERGEVQA